MTGLDLESFLQLLRADLGAWASLALVVVVLGLMTWTSWGSRRALRKCLVLSIAAHVGLVLYGSTIPIVKSVLRDRSSEAAEEQPIRVQLAPTSGGTPADPSEIKGPDGRPARAVAVWDRTGDAAGLADPSAKLARPSEKAETSGGGPAPMAAIGPEAVVLEVNPPAPTVPSNLPAGPAPTPSPTVAPGDPTEVAAAVAARPAEPTNAPAIGAPGRIRPDSTGSAAARPAEVARRPEPVPGLSASPSPGSEAVAGPLRSDPALPAPKPVDPQAAIALGDPSEVAAPKLGPTSSGSSGPDSVAFNDSGARSRARSDATSPGVSPLTALAPTRPAPNPLAPSMVTIVPPTIPPPAAGGPGAGVASNPGMPGPFAPREAAPPASVAADPTGPASSRLSAAPDPKETLPETNARRQTRPGREAATLALNDRRPEPGGPAALPRVIPSGSPALPAIAGATGLTRPPADVPAVYRSRLDPNRFALAQRAGASRASEQAVERALAWLSRHQDADGRWDGGTAKYKDGSVAEGDDDYTAHCPNGDICFGECYYWEADTAITGLALLAYLGAGYTHMDGQYAETVAKGLDYLRLAQKQDGDLRGRSQAVGMYCHAMATLALCEAYALTGDPKLRAPVEKAVSFLVNSRARDGLAWRYTPGAPVGDTSILGWVVMVLKSAQEVGIPIQPGTRQGVLSWLNKVASGPASGLARYQPGEKVTPTMTAEAWVCRQFLSVGGPGMTSTEAADYLLQNGPERSQYNLYYWYYGTLAMYQHGGDAWTRWNAQVRDQIIRRQRLKGHAAGSWDPDESQYGTHGGRIYCTALATLSLEVYYRYLRLYEAPATSPTPPPRPADSGPRRTADIISVPATPR
jgi:hypothetical protein